MIIRSNPIPLAVLRRLPKWACEDCSHLLDEIRRAVKVQTPWLSAQEAADYLRCPLSRVRKLTMTRELACQRDGRRVLYHRDELDKFVLAGGAISP